MTEIPPIGDLPRTTSGTSRNSRPPARKPSGGDKPVDWGDSDRGPRSAVLVEARGVFSGSGHAATLSRMLDRATLFHLLENVLLALLAFFTLVIAAVLVVFAPKERDALVFCIALPSTISSFGLAGFALFRIRATMSGISVSAGGVPGSDPAGTAPTGEIRQSDQA